MPTPNVTPISGVPPAATPSLASPNYIYLPYFCVIASAAMSGNGSNNQTLILDDDADFDLHGVSVVSTIDNQNDPRPNNFSVRVQDANNGRFWSSAAVSEAAYLPFDRITRPVRLKARSNLTFSFNELSGSTNTATVILHGYKVVQSVGAPSFPPATSAGQPAASGQPGIAQSRYMFIPCKYVATGTALSGNASGLVSVPLDDDADFELHGISGSSSVDAANDPRPNNFAVQLTDKDNDRIWSSARVPQIAFVPGYQLVRPVLISRRSNLNFDFLNLSGSTNTPTVVLHGFKVLGI